MKKVLPWLLIVLLAPLCLSDVYMHNPRGSNNRLSEKSANRNNANRVFDSQNNNRGGYNVGDKTDKSAKTQDQQYNMKYFQSGPYQKFSKGEGRTLLSIEWTNQHGCGGNEDNDPHKLNCNIVLQYMCQKDPGNSDSFQNGINTGTQEFTPRSTDSENQTKRTKRKSNDFNKNKVMQESWDFYDKCYSRERNKGLFTADQKLASKNGYSRAIHTRQNPNGNRRGYECPEERDYYPYWHPSPWKDIAILAENQTQCSYYQSESFNVQTYGECVEYYETAAKQWKRWSKLNNPKDCTTSPNRAWVQFHNYLEKLPLSEKECLSTSGKDGLKYIWGIPYDTDNPRSKECLVSLDTPDCKAADWTRSNHLGNGRDGKPLNYVWTLPYFPSQETKQCILRIRYNISTDDFDPYNTDFSNNANKRAGIFSPVTQNPYVKVEDGYPTLRLAINTAQLGRTFQDRSHVFILKPRTGSGIVAKQRVHNVNVRGKRGNIVQTYPAVEYDFHPTTLNMVENDAVHVQWTGSNSHNNGNPAGDGQAGDAGEGTAGTDRTNMVQIRDLNENYPLPFEATTMWNNARIVWIYHGKTDISAKNLALTLSSAGYYRCMVNKDCTESQHSKFIATGNSAVTALDKQLNNSPASFEGIVLQLKKGKYHYMCTRNNNFTNRSQKATIVVM